MKIDMFLIIAEGSKDDGHTNTYERTSADGYLHQKPILENSSNTRFVRKNIYILALVQ